MVTSSHGFPLPRVALILAVGTALGLGWNAFSGRGFALDRSVFIQAGDESIEAPEAKARLDRGALFLDARPVDFYNMSHIPSALPLPEPEFDRYFAKLEERLRSHLQHRRLLRGLRVRGQPRGGPQAPREGHPRRHPQRGLAGLDRRGLPHEDRGRAVSFLRNRHFLLACRLGLAALFLYAAHDKVLAPAAFAKIVYQWQVGGAVFSNLVGVILPWVELVAGLLLLFGVWTREAALVVAALLLSFNLAAVSVLARGIDVENCGCTSVKATAEPSPFRGVGLVPAHAQHLPARGGPGRGPAPSGRPPRKVRRPACPGPRYRPVSARERRLTRGVRVRVKSAYVPERSSPPQGHYFFAYHVRIANEGDETVQLVSRHWIITDGDGHQEHVQGPGVVGEQPVLAPGESFEYTSFCPLATPIGSMHGSYQMVAARRRPVRRRHRALLAGRPHRAQLTGSPRPEDTKDARRPGEPRRDHTGREHPEGGFDFYGPQYARFDSELARQLRREVYGEDIGQQGWRTATEQAEIADLLRPRPDVRILDVACGAGGPSLALVERTGCRLTGLDAEPAGIAQAVAQAKHAGSPPAPPSPSSTAAGGYPSRTPRFEAVLCIDAICHLPDRFRPWRGVARPPPAGRPPPLHRPRGPDRRRSQASWTAARHRLLLSSSLPVE